jgi:putative ABC transport system permease protein
VRGEKGGDLGQGQGSVRQSLPLTLADRLGSVEGVARVAPDLAGSTVLVGSNGTAVRSGGAPTLAFAFDPGDAAVQLVAGRAPRTADEVVVESSTLKLSGLKVGSTTPALVGTTPRTVTVVGEQKFDAGLAGATIVWLEPSVARAQFAPDGRVPSFSLSARPGVSQEQLRSAVAGVLPPNAEAITGTAFADENRAQIGQLLGFINIFLGAFAGVSLFVGMFIIFNTFSMLVAQRTRELALLRAVGAGRGQVLRMVLGEAAVVGLVGALVGIGVGIGLAALLLAFFGTVGLDLSGGLPVLPRTIVVSLLVGVVVTVLAAVLPAVRAARIAPVAAMRDDVLVTPKGLRVRGMVGGGLLALGIALVVTALGDDVKWAQFAFGAFVSVIGALVAAPLATQPVVRVVAAPFVLVAGLVARLARENALRMPRRTAATASALMIGLALISTVSVAAESTKASVADLVERQLTADFVLNGGQAPMPPSVATTVAALPQVGSVATIGFVSVEVGDSGLAAIAAESKGLAENVKLQVLSGSLAALDSGRILVDESTAKARNWSVGSDVTATVATLKQTPLTVGGIYKDSEVIGSEVVIPRALYLKAVPAARQGDFLVYVKAAPGADNGALRTELVKVVKPFLIVSVQDGAEFTASQAADINQLLLILYALLALSVVIAVLGIVNTLALSIFERTREIGLLRAVGLTRGQLTRVITIEAVTTAVFGAVLGTVLGLGLGIALQRGLRTQGLEVLAIPWGTIVTVLVLSAFAGVVAALLPAIRAVRLDVLKAIATQ